MPIRIDQFRGRYFFLSNGALNPVHFEGELYASVGHAFAAAMTLDLAERARIRGIPAPYAAETPGRQRAIRQDWDDVKIGIMRELLQEKYADPKLAEALLSTGDAVLADGNLGGDPFWGIHGAAGENMLGRILMELREQIRLSRPSDVGPEAHDATPRPRSRVRRARGSAMIKA